MIRSLLVKKMKILSCSSIASEDHMVISQINEQCVSFVVNVIIITLKIKINFFLC